MDRVHHEARLHRHRAAVRRIDALDLARDQAIGDIADARAAIALDRRPQQPRLAEAAHQRWVEGFVPVRLLDDRHQMFVGKGARGRLNHALLVGQQRIKRKWVRPVERCPFGRAVLDFGRQFGGDGSGHDGDSWGQAARITPHRTRRYPVSAERGPAVRSADDIRPRPGHSRRLPAPRASRGRG